MAPSRAGSVQRDEPPTGTPSDQSPTLDSEEAIAWLVTKKYLSSDMQITGSILAGIVAKIAGMKSTLQVHRDTLTRVALLMKELERVQEEEVSSLREEIEEWKSRNDEGKEDGEVEDVYNEPATKGSVESLKYMFDNLAEQIHELKSIITNAGGPQATAPEAPASDVPLAQTLYSQVGRNNPPASAHPVSGVSRQPRPPTAAQKLQEERAQAKRELLRRQVLVKIPDTEAFERLKVDGAVHVMIRSRTVIKEILPEENHEDYAVRSVKFMNGAEMLLEVKTVRGAIRMREKAIAEKYARAWAPEAQVVPRLASVIANFVPVTLDITNKNTVSHIEVQNMLKPGTIHSVAWCRTGPFPATQRVGLLKIRVTSRAAANYLFSQGMTIEHKRVTVRMDIKEPLQCLNCHLWAHTAAKCTGQRACGRCGEDHRTGDCDNPKTKYCVSCKCHDHSSNDKLCPALVRQRELMEIRDPDSRLPLFRLTPEEEAVKFMEDDMAVWCGGGWSEEAASTIAVTAEGWDK
jgi:hypothetical protein